MASDFIGEERGQMEIPEAVWKIMVETGQIPTMEMKDGKLVEGRSDTYVGRCPPCQEYP
ncbi:unnamed protein product, partial [Pylaiella littoralis]